MKYNDDEIGCLDLFKDRGIQVPLGSYGEAENSKKGEFLEKLGYKSVATSSGACADFNFQKDIREATMETYVRADLTPVTFCVDKLGSDGEILKDSEVSTISGAKCPQCNSYNGTGPGIAFDNNMNFYIGGNMDSHSITDLYDPNDDDYLDGWKDEHGGSSLKWQDFLGLIDSGFKNYFVAVYFNFIGY